MSEETKRKYNDLAKNSAKTRVPGLTVQKLVQQKLAQTAASAGNITLEEPMMDGISDEDLEQPVNRKRSDEFDGDSDDSTTSLHPPERKRPRVE
ncbi:GL19728 [Drosophila persimilis]|uniref:GL19728 n=1 Tax=Drosophila persimilis TaxID=7234 RepID=B4HB19_DROPE|nr:GL19728 [Drosophila persimilis]